MPLYCNGINDRYIRSACVICPFKELKQIHSRRFPSSNIFSQKSKWICVLNVPDMLIISLAFLLFTVNCAIALQFSFVWVKRCRLTNQFGCRLNYWTSLKKKNILLKLWFQSIQICTKRLPCNVSCSNFITTIDSPYFILASFVLNWDKSNVVSLIL